MRLAFILLITLVFAYGLGIILTIPANPEVRFWNTVIDKRDQEIAVVRESRPGTPIIFFTGGSSCAFSIDPEIIEETCGFPAFNLGLPVACGSEYLLHQSFERTRKGDLLVICLEPDLLTYPDLEGSPSKLSFALAGSMGQPNHAAGGPAFDTSLTISDWLTLARPGARYLITLVARTAGGHGYRYKQEDIRYRGRIETPIHDPDMNAAKASESTSLTPQGRDLVQNISDKAREKGVRLAYSMPWRYTATKHLKDNRFAKRNVLQDMETIIPTIEDGYLGSNDELSCFSDSPQHLTSKGSKLRSQALALSLKRHLETL
jgi:hypothetical protein